MHNLEQLDFKEVESSLLRKMTDKRNDSLYSPIRKKFKTI